MDNTEPKNSKGDMLIADRDKLAPMEKSEQREQGEQENTYNSFFEEDG
jgi:hypothetical protein